MARYFVVLMLLIVVPAHAELMRNLYQAEVEVGNRGTAELARGARAALEEVLIRASGRQDVAQVPALRSALMSARNLLQKYSYSSRDDQLYLNTHFSEPQINRLIESAGLPLWSPNRPPILVWVVADAGGGKQFVKPETHPGIVAVIRAQAQRRGVPLAFPVLDTTDTLALSPGDVWRFNIPSIEQASQRYRASSILVGRLSNGGGGGWIGEWMYLLDGVSNSADSRRDANFAAAAVDLAANQLAAKFAIVTGLNNGSNVLVELRGITGFGDYADAVTYLESISGIEHANMVYQDGSKLIMELVLSSSLEKVEQFFALDRKLEVLEVVATPAPIWQADPARQAAIAELVGEPAVVATGDAVGESEPGVYLEDAGAEQLAPGVMAMSAPAPAPAPQAARVYQWLGSRS